MSNILKKESDKYLYPLDSIEDLKDYVPGINFNTNDEDFNKWGSSGIGAVIIAYDSLLLSLYLDKGTNKYNVSFDSLIFFSTLHFGDNDSTGAIAGSWYGAMYGSNKINNFDKKCKQLEFYDKINDLSNKLINL